MGEQASCGGHRLLLLLTLLWGCFCSKLLSVPSTPLSSPPSTSQQEWEKKSFARTQLIKVLVECEKKVYRDVSLRDFCFEQSLKKLRKGRYPERQGTPNAGLQKLLVSVSFHL